ncbi:MAG: MmgE/PrpD family protein [Acidobacteria bacterium]|nr:MAG: MmgE/PrpD family protein [Acidobacteriota bacterium]
MASAMDEPRKADDVTRRVAEFCVKTRYADLPVDVIALGKKSILDGLGLALSGSVAKTGVICRDYLASLGFSSGAATVLGSEQRAPVRFAAFASGVGIHADDYDDTQLAVAPDRVYGLLTHPTSSVLSAALAAAEAGEQSGRELLLAYHVGAEVACKIAEAIAPRHYQDGFHCTGTCNAFGAAAAVSKLRWFDAGQVAQALGVAGSQASGLRENFGTMTKPFQAGHAAESGVLAAELVARGWTASDQILEAPRGFFHAAGGGFDPGAIVGRLGNPWTFASPGISIKPHPSGSLTHPGMTELARLIREHGVRADQVERIDVGTNQNMPGALIHHRPTDGLQAKFSMEYCMAALLVFGKAGLREFTDEAVNRPDVQSMLRRVRFGIHPAAEAAGYNRMTTIIDIHLADGRTVSGRADFGKGSPADPMSYDDVAAKFQDCAEFAGWPAARTKAIIATVGHLEELPSVRTLATLFGRPLP